MSVVLAAINNIRIQIDTMRAFFYSQKINVFNDYQFIKEAPKIVKIKLQEKNFSNEKIFIIMEQIDELITYLDSCKIEKNTHNYLLYQLINDVNSQEELATMKDDLQKIYS
jgi:hypothetical protein